MMTVAKKGTLQTMANLHRKELSKCRNLSLPLMLSEITGKLHRKRKGAMLRGPGLINISRIYICVPKGRIGHRRFFLLQWSFFSRREHAAGSLWDLHPCVSRVA